jgi:hypothetical protein
MNDHKMLELAAKAVGLDQEIEPWYFIAPGDIWSPLDNDDEAFRVVVELGLSVYTEPFRVGVETMDKKVFVWEEVVLDGFDATRRAITRAAAEVGKAMQ